MSIVKEEYAFVNVYSKSESGKTKSLGIHKIQLLHGFKDQGIIVADKRPVEKQGANWIYIDKNSKDDSVVIEVEKITFEPEEWVIIKQCVNDKKNRIQGIVNSCKNRDLDSQKGELNLAFYNKILTKIEMVFPGELK